MAFCRPPAVRVPYMTSAVGSVRMGSVRMLDGDTLKCSQNYFFTAYYSWNWDTKTRCYARPVTNTKTCFMCSCVPSTVGVPSLATNLGVYNYQATGEQFSFNEYIPDKSLTTSQLSSLASSLVPSLLCCNVCNVINV